MKLKLTPKEPTWWIWLATALLLGAGLAGLVEALEAAILLSGAQTVYFLLNSGSLKPFPVQIRLGYTLLLCVARAPKMLWLYWLLLVGTMALVLFGYCLMARVLSLMLWNRTVPVTLRLVRRTFLSPLVTGNVCQGLHASGRAGAACALERFAVDR